MRTSSIAAVRYGVIEGVVGFNAHAELDALDDAETLGDRGIPVVDAGTAEDGLSGRANGADGRQAEDAGVEKAIEGALVLGKDGGTGDHGARSKVRPRAA